MFLDPETQFVSARHVDAAGWTGDPDDIVVFHMLHHGQHMCWGLNSLYWGWSKHGHQPNSRGLYTH